jgi:hypothetical protein
MQESFEELFTQKVLATIITETPTTRPARAVRK